MEKTTDLTVYISSWLMETLQLDEDLQLLLTQAYRLGRANNPTRPFP